MVSETDPRTTATLNSVILAGELEDLDFKVDLSWDVCACGLGQRDY